MQGEIVEVNFETNEWSCQKDEGQCPLSQVNGIGCPTPLCLFDKNPFGDCGCETQFFINDECNEAFYCASNIPDPYLYDGCHQTCLNGQVLLVDAVKKSWECVDRADYPNYRCPGRFNLECEKDDIGHDFTAADCTCNGELLVSGDCKEAFYCYSAFEDGGRDLQCGPGQIIAVDLVSLRLYCTEDHGECPGLGGLKVGCQNTEIEPPALQCDFDKNPIQECECEGQLMVNEDCTEAFYCSYWTPNPSDDGCHLVCDKEKNEIIYVNPATKEWNCRERPENFICPGKMKIECPRTDGQLWDIKCNCRHEIWMDANCNQAFRCYDTYVEGQGNQGAYARCPDGKVIDIDWENAYQFSCTDERDKCPGSFHFGCDSQDIEDLNSTTEPTTTTTTTTTTPAPTNPPTNGPTNAPPTNGPTNAPPTNGPTNAPPTDGPTNPGATDGPTSAPGGSTQAPPENTTPESGSATSISISLALLLVSSSFLFVNV